MENLKAGLCISVSGIVQGVGFRPFIYNNALKNNIMGSVRNTTKGVEIEIFGSTDQIANFLNELSSRPPSLARIDHINSYTIPYCELTSFTILKSVADAGQFVPVSPDIGICQDCLIELFDPNNRRYRYPFINCTNCGPRFSILYNTPYDRRMTTMNDFPLCQACLHEFEDPLNRRFHAQPVACIDCGPLIEFIIEDTVIAKNELVISTAKQFLKSGKIIAIKGLGGYHLACDATNEVAVRSLRDRKKRTDRPFALMSYDLKAIRKYCEMTVVEANLLESPKRPIVLLRKKVDCPLPEELAPNQNHLGFLLPYTPLHYLLLEAVDGYPEAIVMTSGNISDEPIAYIDEDAQNRLSPIAEGFLRHNRPIHIPVDDSVTRVVDSKPYIIRRSRGYAPDPLIFSQDLPEILACGAEQKNTFCLSRDRYVFASHHIGDLMNYETLKSYEDSIQHYQNLFRVKPKLIAADLHPDYLSTKYAIGRSCEQDLPLLQIQHHHAHLASCLADNHHSDVEPVIGLIFDGTGYGPDGTIWGGEVLIGSYSSFQRRFHLAETLLPGGDTAIRNPWKTALSHLYSLGIPWFEDLPVMEFRGSQDIALLKFQLTKNINCSLTTSMGRLFDAVASLLGIRQTVSYEGQAAIELENYYTPEEKESYPISLLGNVISTKEMFDRILSDLRSGLSRHIISSRFHNGLAMMCLQICRQIRLESGISTVGLSGGVWQNLTLLAATMRELQNDGFNVLVHQHVPTNDGGISLGQLMVASHQTER